MGKHFWPVYIAVASVSCALVWRFAPALGARLPPEVHANICRAVDSAVSLFSGGDAAAEAEAATADVDLSGRDATEPPDAVVQERTSPDAASQKPAASRTPAQRGVRPVDATHAAWGVSNRITPVEKLDGKVLGHVAGGRFFKVKETISTPSGLKITGSFLTQKRKMPHTVRVPAECLICFTGAPGFLTTNQQACLRAYYQLTGEAQQRKEKLLVGAARNSPYLQGAADALRELRAKEKAVERLKPSDADALRKATYEISQLRVKVQELNQKHKDWKAENAVEASDPENDPAYIEILGRRRRYAESIPGLTF